METKEFLAKLSEIMCVPREQMDENYELKPGALDSVTVMEVIALTDIAFGVNLPVEKLTACRSVGDILRLIDACQHG